MDFLIKELDISFNHKELIEYVETLEKDFQHLKWMPTEENLKTIKDYENHNYTGLYGWSIQSNLEDLTIPCPPYDVHKNSSTVYKDTELMFGFALKLKRLFPGIRQLAITAHPANVKIAEHVDNTEYIKIHIPVTSNPQSYFTFGDKQFVMDPGKIYLVNTTEMHGTHNLGNSIRIHMLFKMPTTQWLEISQIKATL